MSMKLKFLIAAAVMAGMSTFASAQTAVSAPMKKADSTESVKAPADPGIKKRTVAVKKKPLRTVVAKKRLSKKKPQMKVGSAKKHTASHTTA